MESRREILDNYYLNYFNLLCNSGGAQGKGSAYIHKSIERFWLNNEPESILEVGAGDGAHFAFLRLRPDLNPNYVALDIRIPDNAVEAVETANGSFCVDWVQGNVEDLKFEDSSFQRVVSTCLFHHLDDPYSAFQEVRRVLKDGGEFSVGMPTDPGILNRLIKRLYTYRRARKLGYGQIELTYALDHQNHIFGLISILENVFSEDDVYIHKLPFGPIFGLNFNLLAVAHVRVKNSSS